jgi:hypothetical protein
LAVQAATGSARHTALQALMVLQGQMALQGTESPVESSFKGRMCRIVAKLFGKVIKAEESSLSPYSSPDMDFDALLYTMEDMLSLFPLEGPRREGTDMAISMMTSILRFRSAADLRELIEELGISKSGGGVWSILMDLDRAPMSRLPSSPSARTFSSTSPQSRDVAQLVSVIGSGLEIQGRLAAIEALRRYRDQHGDEDLKLHLDTVSDNFRDYIWEQLSVPSESPAKTSPAGKGSLPMSERIRNLRSRLNMSESTPAVEAQSSTPSSSPSKKPAVTPSKIPTPSRIPRTGTAKPSASTNVLSLRERLAAAQTNRWKATESVDENENDVTPSAPSSHAAALRARLQAVKHQAQSND